MNGIGIRVGNKALAYDASDAYASGDGGQLVAPVCAQIKVDQLRGKRIYGVDQSRLLDIRAAADSGSSVTSCVESIILTLESIE